MKMSEAELSKKVYSVEEFEVKIYTSITALEKSIKEKALKLGFDVMLRSKEPSCPQFVCTYKKCLFSLIYLR